MAGMGSVTLFVLQELPSLQQGRQGCEVRGDNGVVGLSFSM